MPTRNQHLDSVWWNEGDFQVGRDARRIELRTDGHGVSGYYDRVHIWLNDGSYKVCPAHNAEGWQVTAPPEPDERDLSSEEVAAETIAAYLRKEAARPGISPVVAAWAEARAAEVERDLR